MRLLSLLIAAMLAVPAMTGCQAVRQAEVAGTALNQTAEIATAASSGNRTNAALTLEEAQSIALRHAGFSADQVTALRTEYEVEHGIPQYDVEFRREGWEYDYEIHADTGEILSYNKDD